MGRWIAVALAAALSLTAPAHAQTPSADLARLFEEERAFVWREDPLSATLGGAVRMPQQRAVVAWQRLTLDHMIEVASNS